MRKKVSILSLVTVLLFAVSVMAQTKVVVVPLGKGATGDAVAAEVLDGKTFSNQDAVGITGTLPNIGQQTFVPGTDTQYINQGYHDGSGIVAGDTNLTTENIKSGATIFGVPGKTEIVDTSSGDAVAADIRKGKKAFVDGNMVEGTTVYTQYGCNHSSLTWGVDACNTECETDYPPIPATPNLCYDFCFRLSEAYGDFFLFNNQTTIYNVLCGALP